MSIFKDYQKWREMLFPTLTKKEREIIAAVEEMASEMEDSSQLETEPDGIQRKINLVLKGYLTIAKLRLEDKKLLQEKCPYRQGLANAYPGVDPFGKYCLADMQIAALLEQVKIEAQNCPNQNKEILCRIFESEQFQKWRREKINYSMYIGHMRNMAKVCPNEAASEYAERVANEMERNALAQNKAFNSIFTTLLHMRRIAESKVGEWEEETIEFCKLFDLDLNQYKNSDVDNLNQETFSKYFGIGIPNPKNVLLQEMIAAPENMGKQLAECALGDSSQKELEYIKQATGNLLNSFYKPVENQFKKRTNENLNRGTLIIVGNKTVSEKQQECFIDEYGYDKLKDKKATEIFSEWNEDKLDEACVEYVSDAVMKGEPVELYLPSRGGIVSEKPVQLKIATNKAEAPTDGLLAARNRLQVSKRQIEEQILSLNGMFCTELFLGDYFRDNADNIRSKTELAEKVSGRSSYRVTRSSMVATCFCMLAQKYDIEDIMDPTKLQNERKEAAREYVSRLKSRKVMVNGREKWLGDTQWLYEQFYKGQKAIINQINKKTAGKDLGNSQDFNEMFPKIYPAIQAIFDVYQEVMQGSGENASQESAEGIAAYIHAAEEDVKQESNGLQTGVEKANSLLACSKNLSEMMETKLMFDKSRAILSRPLPLETGTTTASKALQALLKEALLLQKIQEKKDLPLSERCPAYSYMDNLSAVIMMDPIFLPLLDSLESGWLNWEAAANFVLSNDFREGLSMDYEGMEVMHPKYWLEINQNGEGVVIRKMEPQESVAVVTLTPTNKFLDFMKTNVHRMKLSYTPNQRTMQSPRGGM